MTIPTELETPPLGLYVHMPWCVQKCPYCDFNSHQQRGEIPARAYVDALLADLERDLPRVWGRPVSSIYMGGGTPSLFSAAQVDRLLAGIRTLLPLAPGAEISMEANPGTVEHDSFAAYRDAGVNRVSLGVQSFDDRILKAIGRIHGGSEAVTALESLHEAGLENFNVDLMYGLPGQATEQALDDVRQAMEFRPTHISRYQLTLEPNTAFAADPPQLPADEECWDMQDGGSVALADAGFDSYEISAWSRPGLECRHNLNYWRFGDYLGIGAGAHAKLTDPAAREVRRLAKVRHPRRYLQAADLAEDRVVSGQDLVFEYFLNHLRLREGIRPEHFSARTGMPWAAAQTAVGHAVNKGLLEETAGRYTTSALGWRFMNDLQAIFLP